MDFSSGSPVQASSSIDAAVRKFSVNIGSRRRSSSASFKSPLGRVGGRLVRPLQSEMGNSLARECLEKQAPLIVTPVLDDLSSSLFGLTPEGVRKRRLMEPSDACSSTRIADSSLRVLSKKARATAARTGVQEFRCERVTRLTGLKKDYYTHLVSRPDSTHALIAKGPDIVRWELPGFRFQHIASTVEGVPPSRAWRGPDVTAVLSMSGQRIAYGTDEGSVFIKNLSSGEVQVWNASPFWPARSISTIEILDDNLIAIGIKGASPSFEILEILPGPDGLKCVAQADVGSVTCSIKAQPRAFTTDGEGLVAVGTDENVVAVLRRESNGTVSKLFEYEEHAAGVRALGWHPTIPNLIASGGGTRDKTLRIWTFDPDKRSYQTQFALDLGSQITDLAWSKDGSQLAVTFGYSASRVEVYEYDGEAQTLRFVKKSEVADQDRILALSVSPDDENAVTLSEKGIVRVWNLFGKMRSSLAPPPPSVLLSSNHVNQIR